MKEIVIIGAGGTASHLIHPLIAYLGTNGDWRIHIYDADIIEEKNLTRQLFYPFDINQHKANVLAERFKGIGKILPYLDYVGTDNIEKVVKEKDLVFICADNMAVRRVINERAKMLQDIVIFNGGNELATGSVQTYIRKDGKNITPPLDFFSPEFDPANDEEDRSMMSCAEIAQLPGGEQTVTANNSVAALLLQALARYESGVYQQEKQWTKVTFDIDTGSFQTSDVRLIGGIDV